MRLFVTGGTGSFGSWLIRQVLDTTDWQVTVYSRDEFKQSELARTLGTDRVRFVVGDVRDGARVAETMAGHGAVVHTAALKQVGACEHNPEEAVKTNVLGTANVVAAAVRCPTIEHAVLLSTDKCVNPVNLYGATKMTAERLFLAGNLQRPVFNVVRYGNVMDSKGSVLPLYRSLLGDGAGTVDGGAGLPVTDERMTRFWYTFELAIALVRRALGDHPGVVLVGKAPSFRVVDLAMAMAGGWYRCHRRPGEKLHEVLINEYEAERTRDFGPYYRIMPDTELGIEYVEYGVPRPGFVGEYRSDTNPDWLSVEQIKERL